MRTYYMEKTHFVCVVEFRSNSGSIQYDFSNGELLANRPEGMNNLVWLVYLFEFIRICQKMVKPMKVNAEFD